MKFRFIIDAECERTEGKFAGREEIEEQFISELENAQPDLSGLENGGSYDVSDFNITADDPDNISINKVSAVRLSECAKLALALHNALAWHIGAEGMKVNGMAGRAMKELGKALKRAGFVVVEPRKHIARSGTSRRSGRERRDRISDHTMRRPSEVVAHQEERAGERRNGIERRGT